MNVKPGDLAYIIRSRNFPENVGVPVTVVGPADPLGSWRPSSPSRADSELLDRSSE